MGDDADQSLTSILEKTPISALQELATKYRLQPPRYENIKIEGVVHSPTFTFRVAVGELTAVGSAPTKQMAKHRAAAALIEAWKLSKCAVKVSSDADGVVHEEVPDFEGLQISTPHEEDQISGNPIGDLRALMMEAERPEPTYKTTKEQGPAHDRYFEIVCSLNSKLSTTGSGKTKKQAKKEAAFKMLNIVKSLSEEALERTFSTNNNDCDDDDEYRRCFESEPEELLRKVVADQNLKISFTVPERRSVADRVLCFAKVSPDDGSLNLIFTGYGDSADSARTDCCRNTLEYFRVMN